MARGQADPGLWLVDEGNFWPDPYITGVDEVGEEVYRTRADLMQRRRWHHMDIDISGNPLVWRSYYLGADGLEWTDEWSCQCDSDGVEPHHSEWIGPQDAAERAFWESLPDQE